MKSPTMPLVLCLGLALGLVLAPAAPSRAGEAEPSEVPTRHVRVTSADGVSLFLRDYGEGEIPILLLTGGPGYSGDYLEEMAARLGRRHRVLLPDQRGTGRSLINPWDASRITMEASVADVEALRAHSGAERIILVGHSWGGVLALAYAAEHQEHIRALVLIGSGGVTSSWNMRYSANLISKLTPDDLAAVFKAQARMATDPEAATVDMIRATAPAMILDRELAFRSADEYGGPAYLTPAVTLAMQGWLMSYDLGDGLADLDAPVLIVQGVHDPLGEETARELAAGFERSELHLIEGAAHEPFLEAPEEFYGIVEPFLIEQTVAVE